MPTATTTQAEADLDEGLKLANAAVLKLIQKHEDAKAQRDAAEKIRKNAAKELSKLLEEQDLQGFTYGGKVVARLSTVRTPRIDTVKFKLAHPRLFAAFTIVTTSKRLSVTP